MASNATNGDANGSHVQESPQRYVISWDRVHSQPDEIKVICVGAGAGGLYLAYRMQKTLTTSSFDLTIYEK
jgi:hypothetical protein